MSVKSNEIIYEFLEKPKNFALYNNANLVISVKF